MNDGIARKRRLPEARQLTSFPGCVYSNFAVAVGETFDAGGGLRCRCEAVNEVKCSQQQEEEVDAKGAALSSTPTTKTTLRMSLHSTEVESTEPTTKLTDLWNQLWHL